MPRALVLASALVGVLAVSCVRTLPDQDRRIVATPADARMSADVLWKDFQARGAAAAKQYHGRALIVSGVVGTITRGTQETPSSVFFKQTDQGDHGIVANLLDDQADAIIKTSTTGERLTLKCFCEGFDGNILLKSCVKP